ICSTSATCWARSLSLRMPLTINVYVVEFAAWCALAPSAMVTKNSFASDFMMSAMRGGAVAGPPALRAGSRSRPQLARINAADRRIAALARTSVLTQKGLDFRAARRRRLRTHPGDREGRRRTRQPNRITSRPRFVKRHGKRAVEDVAGRSAVDGLDLEGRDHIRHAVGRGEDAACAQRDEH